MSKQHHHHNHHHHQTGNSSSGKHTPAIAVEGDFAEFLQAEELKEKLAKEQEEEIKRELKAAKNTKKLRDSANGYVAASSGGLGGHGKPQSPEERWRRIHPEPQKEEFKPDHPTLEEQQSFPGDLHERQHSHSHPINASHPNSRHQSRRNSEDSEASTSTLHSYASSIAEPHQAPPANPSVISLKSFDQDGRNGSRSIASGGANPALAKPLLELEELELDSFLKNFGRHTREVRIPHSANYSTKRMPRWQDFRIPPDEAEMAAAQGKRVTVLTHVNMGMKAFERAENAEEEEVEEELEIEGADDSQVDGIAWAIAYILASIERYAPEELDNTPDQAYRESRTRSHIERLYLIAPFWERLLFGLRRIYRWEDPRRSSSIAMIYFTLWYLDLIPTAFLLLLMYYVCQFRFFPPSASFLHAQVRARMARGVDADRLAERLRRRSRLDVLELYKRFVVAYGSGTQLAAGDIADFHEKVKNLILWRNPTATWRTLFLLGIATVFVTFASSHLIWKTVFAFLGFTFFILLPLQSHYPRFRRPLSPIWWALWGAPTDAQFAIQLLRRRHLERQHAKHPPLEDEDQQPGLNRSMSDSGRRTSMSTRFADTSGGGGSGGLSSGRESPTTSKHKKHTSDLAALKNRFLRQSSAAAHAVAYGEIDKSEDGKLLDLQDVKVLDGGQILSKPRKLGSFFCQHHGVPGHLHVTTRMVYFVALHTHANLNNRGGHKTCKTPLGEITGLIKTKSIKLLVWNSSGLQITRRNRGSVLFSNMPHRDNAFNLLLAVGSEVWHKHV